MQFPASMFINEGIERQKSLTWDWSDPKRQRKLLAVEDHIPWSYSMLSVTRIVMQSAGLSDGLFVSEGRTKATNILMSKYLSGERKIGSLDRDDALAQNGSKVCAHFGCLTSRYHWDHLIPKSRLFGDHIELNQVRSCPNCNTSRGNLDLMLWHRKNRTFPSLGVLRRYLKLCYFYSLRNLKLKQPVDDAIQLGLPFDPRAFPRKFPPISDLVWDYAYAKPEATKEF